jgi:hypothetical protein
MFDVSEYGTIRLESWDEAHWGKVKAKEGELGRPICGVHNKMEPCEREAESRVGRCREHYGVLYKTSDIFRDPVYIQGVRGIRICSEECKRKEECEFWRREFMGREWVKRPYCFIEVQAYQNNIAEFTGEVEKNEIAVTQVVKMMIKDIAMSVVHIGRCDEELAGGSIVSEEVSIWKVKDSERTTTKPIENPAVGARAKLIKTVMELTSKLLLSPKDKDEKKQWKKRDADESPSETIGRLMKGIGPLPELKAPEVI